jgi:hypothetical protein
MRRRYAFFLLAALLAAPVAQAATGYSTILSGANEVPANPTTATGFATVVLDNAGTTLSYTVSYSGLVAPLTASHIHKAAAGVNGGVLFGFAPPVGTTSGTFSGTITVTAANVADLNAGLYYVNIHSTAYPGGELRGQLHGDATPNARGTWGRIKALFGGSKR